jgi:hypothetical protein
LDDTPTCGKGSGRFVPFIRAAQKLTKVTYIGTFRISSALIDAISMLPDAGLDVHTDFPSEWEHEIYSNALNSVVGFSSTNLHRLQLSSLPISSPLVRMTERCLSNILKTCPSLRILDFPRQQFFEHTGFDLRLGLCDKLPRLHQISFPGNNFDLIKDN